MKPQNNQRFFLIYQDWRLPLPAACLLLSLNYCQALISKSIWKITVEDFPSFILVDDKGNDFFIPANFDNK